MRLMLFGTLVTMLATIVLPDPAQAADVVYVWGDGGIQRFEGTIIREHPASGVRLRTTDGQDLSFEPASIANIIYDDAGNALGARTYAETPPLRAMHEASWQAQPGDPSRRYRDPGMAFLWSLLVPGGGQFYNGDAVSGALLLGGAVVGVAMISNASPYSGDYQSQVSLGQSLVFASVVTSLIMAPIDAAKINRKNGLRACVGPDGSVGVELTAAF